MADWSTLIVPEETLQVNEDLDVSCTRYVSSYTHTLTLGIGGANHTIATKTSDTSWTIPYSDLSSWAGLYLNGKIYLSLATYDGNDLVGNSYATLYYRYQHIVPISWYDDSDGEVGVTIGGEHQASDTTDASVKEAFNVLLRTNFGYGGSGGVGAVHPVVNFAQATMGKTQWFSFKAGDTYKVSPYNTFAGFVTNGGQDILFSIPLPKWVPNTLTITCTDLDCTVYHIGGSLENDFLSSLQSIQRDASVADTDENVIRIRVRNTSG